MSAPAHSAAPARPVLAWPWVAAGGILIVLFVLYPPFHVGSRTSARQVAVAAAAGNFDAVSFADKFWSGQLQPAAGRAAAAGPLLKELQRDPVAASQRHGLRVGLGGTAYFFLRGSGRVTAVERSRLLVQIEGAVVAVRTGPVFGNVVRDGCGLLEVNQVPGLAEFNALSAELNRLVEQRVQPALKGAVAVGATLDFAGCAAAPEAPPAPGEPWLSFTPLQAEVRP